MIESSYSSVRQRLHDKAHDYFIFERLGKREKNQFFGATDALLDTNIDASDFRDAFKAVPKARIMLCYGFLQTLYVQQDAVQTLSKAVGLKDWKPERDPELFTIRDMRNRLCGHPAEAGATTKNGRISSAIIIQHDISENGFSGAIYYDDGFEAVQVDVAQFLSVNQERLLAQMLRIETEMGEKERAFREERANEHFASCFDNGFSYLLQRLHCSLSDEGRRVQADSHATMIKDTLSGLQDHLGSKYFTDRADSPAFRTVINGINLLQEIIKNGSDAVEEQDRFDLLYAGIQRYVDELIKEVRELDAKINMAI